MLDGTFLPPGFKPREPLLWETASLPGGGRIRQVRVTPRLIEELCRYLQRKGEEILRAIPVEEIIEVLDEAAAEWIEERAPDFKEVIEEVRRATGLSLQMTRESIRKEQESSRADDIRAALANEFGDAGVLDRFTVRPGVRAAIRAIGPSLTFCVLPGNIPGLSHLSYMRALLVKSPCLGKTASGESIYAAAYCRTIQRLRPEIAESFAALNWPGGTEEIEQPIIERADAVIAYGTSATCEDIARRVSPETKLVLHSHKLGFALIARERLSEETAPDIARRLAYDIAMFDQQACLSPHWIFIEEGGLEPEKFADELSRAMREIELTLPRGEISTGEAVSFSKTWDDIELAVALGDPVSIHSVRGPDKFLVAIDKRKPPAPSCLGRAIRIAPIKNLTDVKTFLVDYKGFFQNVAIEAPENRISELAEMLAGMGLSRVCAPGRMAIPSMMWHHDGRPCLEALVHYCDLEQQQ